MNFLVKIPAGENGERVKAPTRFTDSKKFTTQAQCTTRRSLGICKAQSGITHSPPSSADFCLKIFIFLCWGEDQHSGCGLQKVPPQQVGLTERE
jgi:hypothetical protein